VSHYGSLNCLLLNEFAIENYSSVFSSVLAVLTRL
jgi:hypothetical protein